MNYAHAIKLLFLAAIWGGSFIFMKVLAPVLGPIITSELRVFLAGVVLVFYCRFRDIPIDWKKNVKAYFWIGLFSSALPFAIFSFAALHIPASYSVIINAMSPLFSAWFSAIWLKERLSLAQVFGFALAFVGLAVLTGLGPVEITPQFLTAAGICMIAPACYGVAGILIKKQSAVDRPLAIATGGQLLAAVQLLPIVPAWFTIGDISWLVVACLIGLSVFGTALAYIIYFPLIAETGPTKALMVTFLMPVFGLLWSRLFVDEEVTMKMMAGCFLILIGVYFVLFKTAPKPKIQ